MNPTPIINRSGMAYHDAGIAGASLMQRAIKVFMVLLWQCRRRKWRRLKLVSLLRYRLLPRANQPGREVLVSRITGAKKRFTGAPSGRSADAPARWYDFLAC